VDLLLNSQVPFHGKNYPTAALTLLYYLLRYKTNIDISVGKIMLVRTCRILRGINTRSGPNTKRHAFFFLIMVRSRSRWAERSSAYARAKADKTDLMPAGQNLLSMVSSISVQFPASE
jgi:hypothetical protein